MTSILNEGTSVVHPLAYKIFQILFVKLVMLVGLGLYFKTHRLKVTPQAIEEQFFHQQKKAVP